MSFCYLVMQNPDELDFHFHENITITIPTSYLYLLTSRAFIYVTVLVTLDRVFYNVLTLNGI